MNIQEYISSGIIEAYVLGLATREEMAEFEKLCAVYPELRKARTEFEISLEETAIRNAAVPAKSLKSKIFADIEIEAYDQQTLRENEEEAIAETPIEEVPVLGMSYRKYMNVAAIILLVGSIALNLYFFAQYRSYSNRYNELLAAQTELANNNKSLQTTLRKYEQDLSMMKDPDMMMVKMAGTNVQTSPDPSSMAMVYYNTRSNQVYLMVSHLPQPGPDKQYQLWAIIDGKPVDAGVFTPGKTAMVPMKSIRGAQAFAITLEKPGGSPTPEGPMYVLGKV